MPTRKILVVNDDPDMGHLLEQLLRRAGFLPLLASDCSGALALAELEQPDLVVLDIDLGPDCSGLDLLRTLRERLDTPVILLSGIPAVDVLVQGFDLGADDYITKPFGHLELIARIHAHLRRTQNPGP
jgi:DNA-binding response OmpR family regulator